MKLVADAYKRGANGEIRATINILDDDDKMLYVDSVNLSKQSSRERFKDNFEEKFPKHRGKDIESQLLQLLREAKLEDDANQNNPAKKSQAEKLLQIVEDNQVELFHTPVKVAYARIPNEGHLEIHPCHGKIFKQWLSRKLYLSENIVPNSDAANSAITTLEGQAIFDGQTYELHNRVAYQDGNYYYDLSDPEWRVIKIK